jgi:hypothetical protein
MTSTTNGYFNSKDKLHSVFNLIEAGASLTCAESVYTKKVTVWLAGPIRLRDKYSHFEFEVPLIAPDPLKYNNTATTGTLDMLTPASLNVTNNGNFNTYPTITLGAGSWAGATLTILDGDYQKRGWMYAVRTQDGKKGWIAERHLKLKR